MKPQLRWWRDLPQTKRNELKQQYQIKTVTFDLIKKVFENK